ncbi:MAG: UDP-N-acetylglucosamine 1-carboxyvinyltransferase [Pseudomonadota bacterium]
MERIRVTGGVPLEGAIPISGAKNAALPLMIASLLTDETLTLQNVPRLADVRLLFDILANHGVDTSFQGKRNGQDPLAGHTVSLCARAIVDTCAPYALVSKMRASFWVIGPVLARMGEARVSLPGGCAIGTRPVDFFIEGLKALGAEIDIDRGYVVASAKAGLIGNRVQLAKPSVGATHTIMMAATLARGETVIEGAACEPEIVDLAACLNAMGAKIEGAGTRTIYIDGVPRLYGARHTVLPDRIEAGTYACAVAMAGGDVTLDGANPEHLTRPIALLQEAGVDVSVTNRGLRIRRNGHGIDAIEADTAPYPGFPTDLQAQFMALMTAGKGTSRITETIFENRFMHVQELARLGAKISLSGQTATVEGVPSLKGAPVMATDLRASVSLVIAGLAAEGDTDVSRIYHLDRGFEHLEQKLSRCGAQITRLAA